MYRALFLSPMVPTFDVHQTAAFLESCLAFHVRILDSQYAICTKDNLTVHLLPAGKDIGQMEFYLEVDDVDAVWASMKDKVAGLKVKEPFNQPYGMREVHVEIPATKTLLFIGQTMLAP